MLLSSELDMVLGVKYRNFNSILNIITSMADKM